MTDSQLSTQNDNSDEPFEALLDEYTREIAAGWDATQERENLIAYHAAAIAARDARLDIQAARVAELEDIVERLQGAMSKVQLLHSNVLVGLHTCSTQAPTDYHAWSGLVNVIKQALIEILYQKEGNQ